MAIEKTLDALQDLARRWADGGYAERYAEALMRHGRYLETDAREEARAIGLCTMRVFLEPYFGDLAATEERIAAYGEQEPEPGIFVLGSGNIGIPLIMNTTLALAAGKRVYFRASRVNAAAVQVWIDALREDPESELAALAERIEVIDLSHQDERYRERLAELPIQQAYLWGGAEAMAETAKPLKKTGAKIYELGPRTGVLLLHAGWWSKRGEKERQALAQACYDNLMKFDCAMCSSPTLGLVIGSADEARQAVAELAEAMTASETERERLGRLAGANAYRRQLEQWEVYGYSLHRPEGSLVTLATGTHEAFEQKQRYAPQGFTWHDSTGSLELISFAPDELKAAADLVAHVQEMPRYSGLWSVAHVISMADAETVDALLQELETSQQALEDTSRVLPPGDVRTVDVRENFGRVPGERFDGIDLVETMLTPA